MCAKAEDGTHTLMKGDEIVEALEEGSYSALLGQCGKHQLYCSQLLA